jgi:hypothetical protein
VHRWSTEQVDPRDRFDYWREVRARGLFGVTAELAPERRPDFFGEFSLRHIGGAGLIELRASPYEVERRNQDIANAPGDSLCIYQQLGGGGRFRVDGDAGFTVHDGNFATSYTDLPYRTEPLAADGFHLRILKIPAAELSPLKTGLRDLVARPFGDHATLAPLLRSCFSDLTEANEDGDTAAAAPLVQAGSTRADRARRRQAGQPWRASRVQDRPSLAGAPIDRQQSVQRRSVACCRR